MSSYLQSVDRSTVSSTSEPGAGRWPSPLPLSGRWCQGTDRRGKPALSHYSVVIDLEYRQHDLRRDSWTRFGPRRPSPALVLVAELSLHTEVPLLGTGLLSPNFKDRPSADIAVTRPLRIGRFTRNQPIFGSKMPHSELVPSLPFLPASTAYSASTTCGFVAPRSQPWGSPRFQRLVAFVRRRTYAISRLSRWRIPFGAFPSTVAVPRHRGRCPLVVPHGFSFCYPNVATRTPRFRHAVDLEALLHSRVRCFVPAFPPERRPMLPWACHPSRGMSNNSRATRESGASRGCLSLPKEKRPSARWERFLRWIWFRGRTSRPCTPPTRLARCIKAEACRRVHAIPNVRRDGVPLPSAVLRHGPKPVLHAPLARIELTGNQ
jgi:hypothetical protein